MHGLGQWEKALLSNTTFHWLSPYPEWFLFIKTSFAFSLLHVLGCQIIVKFSTNCTAILPCSIPNYKTIGQLKLMLWTNNIFRELSLWWVLEWYHKSLSHKIPSIHDVYKTLQWRHNEREGISNHQPYDCLLNCLFKAEIKETSKLRVTCLCEGNSPGTGEFPSQKASNAEYVSIWWRHHEIGGNVSSLSLQSAWYEC